jgi:hypothetical protein
MNQPTRTLIIATLTAALAGNTLAHTGHTMPAAVQVSGQDYAFSTSPALPSGWTTFTFTNSGKELHHFQIARLKPGQTFENFMADLKARGEAATADITFVGGVGIQAPGGKGTVTVNLDQPGTARDDAVQADARQDCSRPAGDVGWRCARRSANGRRTGGCTWPYQLCRSGAEARRLPAGVPDSQPSPSGQVPRRTRHDPPFYREVTAEPTGLGRRVRPPARLCWPAPQSPKGQRPRSPAGGCVDAQSVVRDQCFCFQSALKSST